MGGSTDVLLRRVARLADGWFPQGNPDEHMHATFERLRGYIREAGRDPDSVGLEARVTITEGNLDELVRRTRAWRDLGVTHISINTMGAGLSTPDQHIEAIRRYKEALDL
jgi:alkanesulfonate monooxygenase SsuD/methylene tetrahydromethanopterin reductase-like flavin-dependent oxidoreductase (luciferase family)